MTVTLQSVWGWQPALYLFLGGMGAGSFVIAAVFYLLDQSRHAKTICCSMWASVFCLGTGLALLLSELINPLRGLLVWQSFAHASSWMALGAWGALISLLIFGASAVLSLRRVSRFAAHRRKSGLAKLRVLRTVLCCIGIVAGLFVAVYTGMLLMSAPGVPLWSTPALPCLFTASALDTGVALVALVSVFVSGSERIADKARMLLEKLVVVFVVLEGAAMSLFLIASFSGDASPAFGIAAAEAADMLLWGSLAPYFWGLVIGCGLTIPLVMAAVGLVKIGRIRKEEQTRNGRNLALAVCRRRLNIYVAIGSIAAMVGGCALRFLVLAAGVHVDLITETVFGLIL